VFGLNLDDKYESQGWMKIVINNGECSINHVVIMR